MLNNDKLIINKEILYYDTDKYRYEISNYCNFEETLLLEISILYKRSGYKRNFGKFYHKSSVPRCHYKILKELISKYEELIITPLIIVDNKKYKNYFAYLFV